jgi:hypothetical protein
MTSTPFRDRTLKEKKLLDTDVHARYIYEVIAGKIFVLVIM